MKILEHLGSLVLLLWGGVMVYFFVSGRVDAHLAEEFRIYPLIGGIGLIVLGLFNFLAAGSEVDCGHDHSHDDHDHDDHSHDDHSHDDHSHDDHSHDDHSHDDHDHDCGHERGKQEHAHSHADHDHEHAHSHADHEHGNEKAAGSTCDHGHSHAHETHGHSHQHGHSHDHDHEGGPINQLVAIIILALPLSAAAVYAKNELSIDAKRNRGLGAVFQEGQEVYSQKLGPKSKKGSAASADAAGGEDEYTLADLANDVGQNGKGDYLLNVIHIWNTSGDEYLQNLIKGAPVELVGQVVPELEKTGEGNRLHIYRSVVTCCLNDMRPRGFPINLGEKPLPNLAEGAWVKVRGNVRYEPKGRVNVPVLEVVEIEETTQPEEQYLY